MSLGAIDFGLIVDGAVIIVEAVCHHIGISRDKYHGLRLTQEQMDKEIYHSASKIRKSAAFGEIIIMTVYLPLLTLAGIEGKMFRPMALTISSPSLERLSFRLPTYQWQVLCFLARKVYIRLICQTV